MRLADHEEESHSEEASLSVDESEADSSTGSNLADEKVSEQKEQETSWSDSKRPLQDAVAAHSNLPGEQVGSDSLASTAELVGSRLRTDKPVPDFDEESSGSLSRDDEPSSLAESDAPDHVDSSDPVHARDEL